MSRIYKVQKSAQGGAVGCFSLKSVYVMAITFLGLMAVPMSGQSAFTFNFNAQGSLNDKTQHSCGGAPGPSDNCEWDNNGIGNYDNATPYRAEVLNIDGTLYWHTILGKAGDAFRQEAYIAMGNRPIYVSDSEPGGEFDLNGTSFSDSGGFPSGLQGKGEATGSMTTAGQRDC